LPAKNQTGEQPGSRPVAGRLRVLVDEPAEAAWNMAVDGALLELAEEPTLRIYGWQPHAVSLGYFQAIADFADLPEGTSIVRRTTGGGAIHHGDELTFSLALPASLLPGDIAASYVLLHDAIVRALATIGVTSHRATSGKVAAARPSSRWCFEKPVRDDLITDTGKLLGSAQRRTNTSQPRVLHHGSLVLNRPQHTPFVAAVCDQVPITEFLRNELRTELIAEITKVLGLAAQLGERTAAEVAMTARLCDEQFRNPAHLHRR
jgi:lipoate-protein ligase A